MKSINYGVEPHFCVSTLRNPATCNPGMLASKNRLPQCAAGPYQPGKEAGRKNQARKPKNRFDPYFCVSARSGAA